MGFVDCYVLETAFHKHYFIYSHEIYNSQVSVEQMSFRWVKQVIQRYLAYACQVSSSILAFNKPCLLNYVK